MTKPNFYLTRQAARALRDIYQHSLKQWGQAIADAYMADLYSAMNRITLKPEMGQLRMRRASPFLMVPAREHFIIYDCLEADIVVLTLLHQRRDIEHIISKFEPDLLAEIEHVRSGKT